LKSNTTGDPRAFWKNALKRVVQFWDVPGAGVLGLQELNETATGSGTGSDAIQTAIAGLNRPIAMRVASVDTPTGKPAVGLLWDSKRFGDEATHTIVDLDYTPTEPVDPPPQWGPPKAQKGRPLLMVKTSTGLVFATLHAPNQPDLSKRTQSDLRAHLKKHLEAFSPETPADRILVMGDFNDGFDGLTSIDVAGGTLRYQGAAPRSCCHHWITSCTTDKFETETYGDVPTRPNQPLGKCSEDRMVNGTKVQIFGKGPRTALGSEGDIENYRMPGDKVFGAKPVSELTIFPSGRKGASVESDHEFVIGSFQLPVDGGRRRKTRRRRRTRKTRGRGTRAP